VGFGRLATGVLKGYDALINLVRDEVEELLIGESKPRPPPPLESNI
jgi:U6 snRNA-associated Sm-like protein LSm7